MTPGPLARLRALSARVTEGLRRTPAAGPASIVAICHCHYPELVPELAQALDHLPEGAQLHVTSSSREVRARWRALGRGSRIAPILHATENRGRDVRPFFEVLRRLPLEPDTLIVKLHGKKSSYSATGEQWRRDLLAGLVPDGAQVSEIVERFRQQPDLGMLGAPGSFISSLEYWGGNRDAVRGLMARILGHEPADEELGFFAGTMFWMRGAVALRMLPHVDLAAFEPEAGQQDGTYAHALERVIPMAAARMGLDLVEAARAAPVSPADMRHRKVVYL